MSTEQLFGLIVFAIIGGFVGYSIGQDRAWSHAIRECFDPFYAEGYYNGWIARHSGAPLEDRRVHPDELNKLVPTLNTGQETAQWMLFGDHLQFEHYRAEQVDKLNGELECEKQIKNGKSSNDDVALLIERFANARWIHSSILVNSKGKLDFTKLGYDRMQTLVDAFQDLGNLPSPQFNALIGLLVDFRKQKNSPS